MFAATLAPPSDRTNLVASEVASLAISQDGWLGSLILTPPVTVSGRVEAYCPPPGTTCMTGSLGATITVTRPSAFAGGPGFRAVVTSKDSIARGTDSFSLALPPAMDPLVVTVVPDGRSSDPPANGISPAMEVPPLRTTLDVSQDTSTTFVLGSATSPQVLGSLSDGVHALTKYRVVVLGQWEMAGPVTEVSSVAYTPDGSFKLLIADNVVGSLEIVAQPYDPTIVAPTLHLPGVRAGTTVMLTQPANLGNKLVVTIPVVGLAGNGAVAPISGARVIVTGRFNPQFTGASAELSVEATTGDDGLAQVTLLDGPALRSTYKVRVIPPAGANVGVVYDAPLALGPAMGAQTVASVRLPSRIALRGTLVDQNGQALGNVAVTARPSLRFTWSLDTNAQSFLAQIPAATTVTPDTGDFILWVDPFVADIWGHYDVSFEPATGIAAPSWTEPDVEIPRIQNLTSQSLGSVTIPDAANVHGQLTDQTGGPVSGGELRIFGVTTDLGVCSQVAYPPANCSIPAQLLAHGTSDDLGTVRLRLPR
jgi:hypothetical protein